MQISKIMSTRLVSVEMDDSLSLVKDLFDQGRFHHLLVNGRDGLCGVISDRDLLKALSPNIGKAAETSKDLACLHKKAHQILTRKPITLPSTATVYDAIDIFNESAISCIPIVNQQNKAVGIVSWRDIIKIIKMK